MREKRRLQFSIGPPAHDQALLLLVDASRSQRELDDAEQRLRSLNAADKTGFHLAWASLFLRKRDLPSAENEVKQALLHDPNSIEAHVALAKDFLVKKRPDQGGSGVQGRGGARTSHDPRPLCSTPNSRHALGQRMRLKRV